MSEKSYILISSKHARSSKNYQYYIEVLLYIGKTWEINLLSGFNGAVLVETFFLTFGWWLLLTIEACECQWHY